MRWDYDPEPEHGDIRMIKYFAFLPVVALRPDGTQCKIFLESYMAKEIYRKNASMLSDAHWSIVERHIISQTQRN